MVRDYDSSRKRLTKGQGRAIACGYADGKISLFDVESGMELFCVKEHTAPITFMEWSAVPVGSEGLGNALPHQRFFHDRSQLLPKRSTEILEQSEEGSSTVADFQIISESTRGSLTVLCGVSHNKVTLSYVLTDR